MATATILVRAHAVDRWLERIAQDDPMIAAEHIERIASEGSITRERDGVRTGPGVYLARHEAYPNAIVVLVDSKGAGRFHAVTVIAVEPVEKAS